MYQDTHHIFRANDNPACADYRLQRTAIHDEFELPDAARALKKYINQYLDSLNVPVQFLDHSRALIRLLNQGGFKLTEYVSGIQMISRKLSLWKIVPKQKHIKGWCGTLDSSFHVPGLKCLSLVMDQLVK